MARPSFLGLVASGILLLVALIGILMHSDKISPEHGIMIVLLFAIAISAHSLQHAIEEIFFRFNPLRGQWVPTDDPVAQPMPMRPMPPCHLHAHGHPSPHCPFCPRA